MGKLIYRSACVTVVFALAAAPGLGQAAKSSTEADLIKVLKSGTSSLHQKEDACRQLATVGTRAAVPTLTELLSNEKLAHMARYAMEPIPDPAVDEALRAALAKVKGRLLVGVIGSIGVRRDAQATDALVKHLADADAKVAQAAARSLGRIATPEAVRGLMQAMAASPPEANEPALYEGLFRCAETLAANGSREEAQAIYDVLRAGKAPPQIAGAALRGAILMRKGKDRLELLREQLRAEDRSLFTAAVRAAQEIAEPDVVYAMGADLKTLPAERRPVVIQALACVADKCLQRKDAAGVASRLIGPLNQAMELAQSAELKEQTNTLLQAARKLGAKIASGAAGGETPFLEVGKTYTFRPAGNSPTFRAEVLIVRNDCWVKVHVKGSNNYMLEDLTWVNLNQISFIGVTPKTNDK